MNDIEARLLTVAWSDSDLFLLSEMAKDLGTALPQEYLKVMVIESALDPAAYNKAGAVGIIQFTRIVAVAIGDIPATDNWNAWTAWYKDMLKRPVSYQLGKAKKFFQSSAWFQSGGRFDSGARIYVAVAAPNALPLAKTPETVLYEKGSVGYDNNPQLDVNHDGKIDVQDLQRVVNFATQRDVYKAAIQRLESVVPQKSGY